MNPAKTLTQFLRYLSQNLWIRPFIAYLLQHCENRDEGMYACPGHGCVQRPLVCLHSQFPRLTRVRHQPAAFLAASSYIFGDMHVILMFLVLLFLVKPVVRVLGLFAKLALLAFGFLLLAHTFHF